MKLEGIRQQGPKELQTNSYGRNKQTRRTPGLFLMFFHSHKFISRQNFLAGSTGSSSSHAFLASLTGDNDLPTILGSLAA